MPKYENLKSDATTAAMRDNAYSLAPLEMRLRNCPYRLDRDGDSHRDSAVNGGLRELIFLPTAEKCGQQHHKDRARNRGGKKRDHRA